MKSLAEATALEAILVEASLRREEKEQRISRNLRKPERESAGLHGRESWRNGRVDVYGTPEFLKECADVASLHQLDANHKVGEATEDKADHAEGGSSEGTIAAAFPTLRLCGAYVESSRVTGATPGSGSSSGAGIGRAGERAVIDAAADAAKYMASVLASAHTGDFARGSNRTYRLLLPMLPADVSHKSSERQASSPAFLFDQVAFVAP